MIGGIVILDQCFKRFVVVVYYTVDNGSPNAVKMTQVKKLII